MLLDMVMKPRDFKDAQNIIDGIRGGALSRRDLVSLLIYVREYLPYDMTRDIAHCVAHSDRDRGHAYAQIKSFVVDFIRTARGGGTITVKPVFDKDELVGKLTTNLKAIGLEVTQSDLLDNYNIIQSCLTDILSDTTILIKHPNVKSCRFTEHIVNGQSILTFEIHTRGMGSGGALPIPEDVGMAFPVFSLVS